MLSRSVVSDSLWPHGLEPARLLCPWGFSRQEYWSGWPCYPPGSNLSYQIISSINKNAVSPTLKTQKTKTSLNLRFPSGWGPIFLVLLYINTPPKQHLYLFPLIPLLTHSLKLTVITLPWPPLHQCSSRRVSSAISITKSNLSPPLSQPIRSPWSTPSWNSFFLWPVGPHPLVLLLPQ